MFLMSNQVYSRYLYQMLMEFGSVSVPSLGTFALNYSEAAFQKDKVILIPPYSTVIFEKDAESATPLKDLLFEAGMESADADAIQESLIQDYRIAQSCEKPFELDNFGTIVNRSFIEKDLSYFNRYAGLNSISVKAVPLPIRHDEDYLFRLSTPQKTQEVSSFKSYLWPSLIGLFVLAIILLWLLSAKKPTSVITNTVEEPTTILPNSNESIITDTIVSIMDMDTMESKWQEKNITNQPDTSKNSTNKDGKSGKSKSSEEIKEHDYESNNSCIVIVGAFKDTANANKLLKSIASRGYKTFSSNYNGLRRVGVTYDCTTTNPETFKIQIRKVFNKDAWHLHDTL